MVPKEPKHPAGQTPAEDDEKRTTLAPDARELAPPLSMRPSPPRGTPRPSAPPTRRTKTPLGLGAARPPSPTLTDPEELEAARRKSMGSSPENRKVTPVGALSLANACIPSIIPPASGADWKMTAPGVSRVDPDLRSLPTAPPPGEQEALISATTAETAPPAKASQAPTPAPPAPITEQEMKDRFSVGDFSGALAIADKLLSQDPDNAAAIACAESCRDTLKKMYAARIGRLDRVPVVSVPRDQMRWLSIDHRAGFVLSLIDGVSTVEMVLDVTGMPELDALRILSELVQQRIVSFK